MKAFPKLDQRQVRIILSGGNSIAVDMLPVRCKGEIDEITLELAKGMELSVLEIENLRQRMVNLIATVLPKEYVPNLGHFECDKLVELILYLFYGDDDDLPEDAKKKPEPKP